MAWDDSLTACAQIVERGDPDRFAATMAAPVDARGVLFPIYACNVEAARAPYASQEPLIAEMRLQWWWDALEEIATGAVVRSHEVTVPLAHAIDADAARAMQEAIDARRSDARRDDPETLDDLHAYLRATGGGLMWAATQALGGGDEARARDVGTAQALANYLLAVPDLMALGRKPFPETSRGAFGDLITRVARDMQQHKARPSKPQRIAELAAWRAPYILRQALKRPEAVGAGKLAEAELLRRVRLALRAALA